MYCFNINIVFTEKPVINKYIKGEERKINNNQRSSPKSCMMLNKFKVSL